MTSTEKAIKLILDMGGIVRASQAVHAGIHPRILYKLRDSGMLKKISRGVYCLSEQKLMTDPDLSIVAIRFPSAVICLVSALAYHGITTQIPNRVSIALLKGAESPRLDYPPISVYRFSKDSFNSGIEEHKINSIPIRIYDPEKTLVDCFKFRNKIGMDIVIEALKLYNDRKKINLDKIIHYAKICRVEKVMIPYLEVLI
jgi:predicted transcriptional regulator of viral defense system